MEKTELEHFLDDDYKYKKAAKDKIDTLRGEFFGNCYIPAIVKSTEYPCVGTCDDVVNRIVDQVRKRMLYFHIYHDTNGLSEIKEISLYCFWVLKWQPFYWKDGCAGRSNCELNIKAAIRLFTKGLNFFVDKENENLKKRKLPNRLRVNLTESIFGNLKYSFEYRDWSKEALMDLAESLIINETLPTDNAETQATE